MLRDIVNHDTSLASFRLAVSRIVMTRGQRIADARKAAGLTQAQLAEALGVGQSTVGQWEKDKNEPTLDTLQKIAEATKADASWLAFGAPRQAASPVTSNSLEGLDQAELTRRIDARLEAMGLSERKACLKAGIHIATIQRLRNGGAPTPGDLGKLAKVLDVAPAYFFEVAEGNSDSPPDDLSEMERQVDGADITVLPPGYVAVPTLDVNAGLGNFGQADEDMMAAPRLLPTDLIERDLRGTALDFVHIEVEGPSMSPVLESGDQVLVDRRKQNPSQPGIFALYDGFGLVVKWVERVHASDPPRFRITSESERFQPYEVLADEAQIIGRVVWFARRM